MNMIKKLASSLDDAISLVLGENIKRPIDLYTKDFTFFNRY
jgi:hypothetical protein